MVTGAADDDPSGIATYSQTGAQFGYGQLWTIPLMLPMMFAVQEMCARIGIVRGRGIAGVVREFYPKSILYTVVMLMLIANTINLGTDLGGMAAALRLIVPLPYLLLISIFALLSISLEVFVSYHIYSRFLKWMSISLFAYVLTGFIVSQDWLSVLRSTFVPHVEWSFQFLLILVGVLGTTISPYMFFWQASQEVEEEIEQGKLCPQPRVRFPKCGPLPIVSPEDIHDMRVDTWLGMLFSQTATWFIIITAAGALHVHGVTDIATAADAARALEPLVKTFHYAGTIAKTIFAVGIIGLGLLAIPIFAGSASYALAETFNWKEGLYRKPSDAPQFYAVMIIATLIGALINLLGISPMKALIYTAVINGIIAVPLILTVLLISNNPIIMGRYTNPRWVSIFGLFTFLAMGAAGILMFIAWLS